MVHRRKRGLHRLSGVREWWGFLAAATAATAATAAITAAALAISAATVAAS